MPENSRAVQEYLDRLGELVGEPAGPESLHPEWQARRDLRHPSLTLKEGTAALKRDAAVDGYVASIGGDLKSAGHDLPAPEARRFIWPDTTTAEEKRGEEYMSMYARAVKRMAPENKYATAVRDLAARPFSGSPTVKGWSARLESMMSGEAGGMDGKGSDLMTILHEVFVSKLFAGVHYLRGEAFPATSGALVPALVHLEADHLMFWDWQRIDGKPRLLSANVHLRPRERLTFNTAMQGGAFVVFWAKWVRPEKGEDWTLDSENVVPGGKVPIHAFTTEWSEPFYSPPPFEAAADRQMECARQSMALDKHRGQVANGNTLAVTNWKGGRIQNPETGEVTVRQLPVQAGGLVFVDEANVEWVHFPGTSVEVLQKALAEDLLGVEEMCMSTARQRVVGPDVTATEVTKGEARTTSFLKAAVSSDLATIKEALAGVAAVLGPSFTAEGEISLPMDFDVEEHRKTLAALMPWHAKKIVDNVTVAELLAMGFPALSPKSVERMLANAKARDEAPEPQPLGEGEDEES